MASPCFPNPGRSTVCNKNVHAVAHPMRNCICILSTVLSTARFCHSCWSCPHAVAHVHAVGGGPAPTRLLIPCAIASASGTQLHLEAFFRTVGCLARNGICILTTAVSRFRSWYSLLPCPNVVAHVCPAPHAVAHSMCNCIRIPRRVVSRFVFGHISFVPRCSSAPPSGMRRPCPMRLCIQAQLHLHPERDYVYRLFLA